MVPSEGSVIAYYLSEFRVPAGQEASTDKAMEDLEKSASRVRLFGTSAMQVEEIVTSGGVDNHLVCLVGTSCKGDLRFHVGILS